MSPKYPRRHIKSLSGPDMSQQIQMIPIIGIYYNAIPHLFSKEKSLLKNAENMRFAGIFLCIFLFRFQGFGLVDIDARHKPVKLSPGQISDLGLFPRPLVSAMHCQLFIDQYKTICIAVQGLDPGPASATEQKQGAGCRIQPQLFLHAAQSPSMDLRMSV